MEPVFIHHRLNGRHFGDLVPDRFGVVAVEVVAAPATVRWLALDGLPELFGRDQGASVTAMIGLTASFLPRGGSRGPSLDRRWVGGWGLEELVEF
jgi:hypothetical protein